MSDAVGIRRKNFLSAGVAIKFRAGIFVFKFMFIKKFLLTEMQFLSLYIRKLPKLFDGGGNLDKNERDLKISEMSKSVLSFCMARTSTQQEAEDLAQDILLELVKALENIRDDRAFYSFMWSVAGNVYKQWYRKKQKMRECALTENMHSVFDGFDSVFEDNHEIYLLRRELMLLSEKYRRATILYYLENKSCSEISDLLSVSEGMVKYLLFKSRKILKGGMEMERNYGEQSYNPKNLNLMYMGEGPNRYWELLNGNKIRQNILWACYNDSLSEDEIALQIGVSLPYIEEDIATLTDTWLLRKDGKRYKTNIIILTDDFEREKAASLITLQKEAAEIIRLFIDENQAAVRNIGFYGNQMSLNSLKWHMVTMILLDAYRAVENSFFEKQKRPLTAFGEHAYVWGAENPVGGFNCCTIDAEEWHTGISLYFMDWSDRPELHHSNFYCNMKWVKMYDKITHESINGLNEFEQEIVSEMLRKGYVIRKNGKILSAMPVYKSEQRDSMTNLQKSVVEKTGEIMKQMYRIVADVLLNHVPPHLKAQVPVISAMSLFRDGTYIPASLLVRDGYLSTEWMPDEIATSYAVIK